VRRRSGSVVPVECDHEIHSALSMQLPSHLAAEGHIPARGPMQVSPHARDPDARGEGATWRCLLPACLVDAANQRTNVVTA
jgi:hypothetical protein